MLYKYTNMLLQIVSDLHLEFWNNKTKFNFIKPSAPVLALLGDICCCVNEDDFSKFKQFIMEILPSFELIIFVCGNHEYYHNKKNSPNVNETIQNTAKKISAYFKNTSPKLKYLNNSTLTIKEKNSTYTIIGSTLWTWIPEENRKIIQQNMNDYNSIYYLDGETPKKLTSDVVAAMHLKNRKYIKAQIDKAKAANNKIIVFTHHKPYLSETQSNFKCAYESDLLELVKEVNLWAYGHTHVRDNKAIGKSKVYSNPKGYPNQKTKFHHDEVVKV